MKQRQSFIYRVSFNDPPIDGDPRRDFFFTSIAAIYDVLTPEQVGCRKEHLWNLDISRGRVYNGKLARITREILYTKRQTKRRNPDPDAQQSDGNPDE